ncbi:hypothetical protein MASR2M12_03520 [Bacteroidales bacterium]
MKITTLQTAEKVPFNLDGRKMFSSKKVELVHLTIQPGEEIAPHANPFDVVFFVLEGQGEIMVNQESFLASENNSVFIEKDKQRGLRNTGDGLLRVLVVKIF